MKIDRVTVTGADESIEPRQLYELSEEFPFVEWGILVSKKSEGTKKFPGIDWLYEFSLLKTRFEAETGQTLNASCHICGRWMRDLLMGGEQFIQDRGGWLDRFQRIQINTHAETLDIDKDAFIAILKKIVSHEAYITKQFIIQQDGVNDGLLHLCIAAGIDAVPLFDMSHGEGISPDSWPEPIFDSEDLDNRMRYCGYAGGLGPDNLESELRCIARATETYGANNSQSIWIDMETKVRSHNDQEFNLNKVRTCLELTKPYVVGFFEKK